ncbi:hydrogenase small subunit [Candidatus Parabeggiatoa sp. HSG14]|uniref:hydrogenase small subunit n=1 Tax=Candidatus Parabeggiatoa sp. HSG14 TaxID=3055593 RepID=UPI0025A8CC01|nr:hydrogenase small subunit [Thiotrichales bacterium HSG14]
MDRTKTDDFDFTQVKGTLGNLTRRDFIKFCTGVAATLGLASTAGIRIAEAAASGQRPPVIWLSGQECTGCSETLLRATHPTLEGLILDTISLDYHEALSAAAGHQAEAARHASMEANKGKYILVVEGAIPTKHNGIYCKIANKTILAHVKEAAEDAATIVAIGSCASWGGVASTPPNPTGAVGLPKVLADKTIVSIPGCPPNPYNLLATLLHFLTFNKLPQLDEKGRPLFAYGRLIHENCERRPHFDAGRFAMEFGDEGHRKGWCLYKLGCKGPETYANCPAVLFGDVGSASWPVGTGHPCIGCTEQGVVFQKPIHALAENKSVEPPVLFPRVVEEQGIGITPGAAAVAGGITGALLGAGAMIASKIGESTNDKEANENDAKPEKA